VDYIFQLTPEEQRRVAGAMGRSQTSSNRTSPGALHGTTPAGGSARGVPPSVVNKRPVGTGGGQ